MTIHTSASALLKTLKTFSASVLMLGMVMTSFPFAAVAQEGEPVTPTEPEVTQPLNCTDGQVPNEDGTECVDPETTPDLGEMIGEVMGFRMNQPSKVNICHKTSSESNPWEAQRVNESSWSEHRGHGDFLYEGPVNAQNQQPSDDGWCDENAPEPEVPSITINATKVVCDTEADLPNTGDIVGAIDANTAGNWVSQSDGACQVAKGWEFEWAPAINKNGGATTIGHVDGYTTFSSTVTVPIASLNGRAEVREVLKADYVPFAESGEVGAKLYCTGDAGGIDNWEWLNNPTDGKVYDCVAFNAPTVPPQQDMCTIYSDTDTLEGADAAVLVPTLNSRWTANDFSALAKWIWGENPMIFTAGQEVETFTRTFHLDEAASGAELKIAADNAYEVKLDGNAVCSDSEEFNYQAPGDEGHDGRDICTLGPITAGTHVLTFKVTNYELANENFGNNPAGLRYEFNVTGSQCSPVPQDPEEPTNTCVAPDNAGSAEVPFGTTPSGEKTLQQILNAEYGAGAPDADDDQDNYQEWDGTGQDVTFTVENISEASNSGHRHVFGYYLNGSTTFVPVFRNGNVGAPHSAVDEVAFGASKTFTVSGVNSIVFAIGDWSGSSYTYFATKNSLNASSEAHAVSYNVDDNTYAIAFEDLLFAAGDEDYNDIAVSLHVDRCENAVTCDPKIELLKNGGFESPAIAAADWDIVPSGTTGLEWLVEWINPTGAPATANAEFQKNVSGWTAHSGAQYAELDADWTGHTSQTGEAGAVTMSQTITTVPNQKYTFSFWFSPRPDQGMSENKAEVLVDGVVVYTTPAVQGSGDATMNWTKHTVTFTAPDSSTVVALRDAAGNPNNSVGTFVDDASLTCTNDNGGGDDDSTITVNKEVVGTEDYDVADFDLYVGETQVESGVATEFEPGTYEVSEAPSVDFVPSFSGACEVDETSAERIDLIEDWQAKKLALQNAIDAHDDDDDSAKQDQIEDINVKIEALQESISATVDLSAGEDAMCTITNTFYKEAVEPTDEAEIVVTKVMCSSEQYLPNWGAGAPNITQTTVDGFLTTVNAGREVPVCWLEPGWEFETAPEGTANPGDNVEFGGEGWSSAGITDIFGEIVISFDTSESDFLWIREAFKGSDTYVPFSGLNTTENVSAELYCDKDVLHYDNYDYIDGIEAGATYYCAAFNAYADDDDEGNDVCSNLDGTQEVTPEGYENNDGICTIPDDGDDNNNDGGSNRSGNHRRSGGGGEVLGVSTECSALLNTYMHIGWNNDPAEVTKLQTFLNQHLGIALPVTGFFGDQTFEAVKTFQSQYWEGVLKPWFGNPESGITAENTPTGFVYQTTRWQINNIVCPGSEAFPTLI